MTARVASYLGLVNSCTPYTYSSTPLTYLNSLLPSIMSDQDQPLSDAEKMRLKRLARLGGTSNPISTQQPSTTTDRAPEVQETTTPREPPSAGSRLLNIKPKPELPEPSSQAGPSSSSPAPKAAVKPIKAPSPGPALLGKRPSSAATPARASQPPPEVPRVVAPPPRLSIPYPEWEAQRVQAVFSVTLNVRPPSLCARRRADASARRRREE